MLIISIPISFRELLSYFTLVPNLEAEAKGKRLLQVEGIHSKYCMSGPKAIVSTADYQPGTGFAKRGIANDRVVTHDMGVLEDIKHIHHKSEFSSIV